MNSLMTFLILILSATCSLAHALTVPNPVVSAGWLVKNKSEVQIIEVASNLDSFMNQSENGQILKADKRIVVDFGGHIEGSTMMDFSIVRVDRVINGKKVKNLIPSAAVFQKIVQSAGVNSDRHIVLVPFGQKVEDIDEALRIFWQFKVYGQTNISILDGGLTGWLAEGRDVTVSNASKLTGNWMIKGYRKDLVATSDSVARASGTSTSQLIDARDSSVYSGLTKGRVNDRYGYIKGAKNLSPDYLTRSENGALYFLDKVTYEARLSEAGIESNTSSIIYCENGLFAAGPWFVMSEIVGNQSVKLYDGSLHLWITEGRPLVTTD